MAARGPYKKTAAKRAEILETALDVIDKNGFSGATVKELADAVGMSQNGMLYYFGSKDALFLEILRRHDEAVALEVDYEHADFSRGLATRITDALVYSVEVDGVSQLLMSLLVEAKDREHVAHDYFRERYESFQNVATRALTDAQSRGDFPTDASPTSAGAVIAAAFDGLQMLWMYDQDVDVRGQMTYLLNSLGIVDNGAA